MLKLAIIYMDFKMFRSMFSKGSYLTFLMFTKSLVQCTFITPRTVPDDVALYPNGTAANLDLGKNPKPWLAYINSSISKSFSECWKHIRFKSKIWAMKKCVLHLQPSYKIIQNILDNSCPASYNFYNYEECIEWLQPLKATKSEIYTTRKFKIGMDSCINFIKFPGQRFSCIFFELVFHKVFRVNITFIELNMIGKSEEAKVYFDRFRNSKYYSGGRWPKTTVLSPANVAHMYFDVLLSEIHGMYQVTDNYTMWEYVCSYPCDYDFQFDPEHLNFYTLWKSTISLSVAWIYVRPDQRLIVHLSNPHGIHIHDGPGILSDQLNHNNSVLYLSSFQTFIVVYTEKGILDGVHIQEYGVSYKAMIFDRIRVHVVYNRTLVLPPCSFAGNKNRANSGIKFKRNAKQENYNCVYNITTEKGYVKLSIKKLTFSLHHQGVHDEILDYLACPVGGVAFGTFSEKKGFPLLCANYTTDIKITSSHYKLMLDGVSETKYGLILVAYSYKHYSSLTLEATVTSTPCGKIDHGPSLFSFVSEFDVSPNHCITLHDVLGKFKPAHCFINKVKRLKNHKLYRHDSLIRHIPSEKFEQDLAKNTFSICPYYLTRLVRTNVYNKNNFKVSMSKFEVHKGNKKEALIENKIIEYPQGAGVNYASYTEPNKNRFTAFYYMSSTIYHINCSKSPEEISKWSGLNTTLVHYICMAENLILKSKIAEFPLLPPYVHSTNSNIWKLKILFSKCVSNLDNFGHVVFKSLAATRICKKVWAYKYTPWPQCAAFVAKIGLNTGLSKTRNVFELGFQKFEASSISYYPNTLLTHKYNTCELYYKWEPDRAIEVTYFTKFAKSLKLVQYTAETKCSWEMAAEKCKELGMVLPHLESEKSTRQFVSYILKQFSMPIYSIFIGLIYKEGITKWINNNPLIYFPWESKIITESTHFELMNITQSEWYIDSPGRLRTDMKPAYEIEDKYLKLYPDVQMLSAALTSQTHPIIQCYMLSLFNPMQPHFRSVNCYRKLINVIACEKHERLKSNRNILYNVDMFYESYGSVQCLNGQFISTLFICDGFDDCPDGSDEVNCFCLMDGRRTNDSIYCSTRCIRQNNCSCPTLYTQQLSGGCHSYRNQLIFNSQNNTYLEKYACKNSTLIIEKSLFNDLLFDCPHHDDENKLFYPPGKNTCKEKNLYECYPGHSKCYTREQKCVYDLTTETKILKYCRSGKHLQDCKSIDCGWKFKCPNSYCIPYRYICDGRWDCWNGEDEVNCGSYSCKNMFKCKLYSTCIHSKNVCDGTSDCPLNDDEMTCDILKCYQGCTCLNFAISCKGVDFTEKKEKLFDIITNFVFINISSCNIAEDNVDKLASTIIFIAPNNSLKQSFICDPSSLEINTKILDLSFNKIVRVQFEHISCLLQLAYLNLRTNMIVKIANTAFKKCFKLMILLLDNNMLTSLNKYTFMGPKCLVMVSILGNNILYMDSSTFSTINVQFILTNNFPVCCMNLSPETICTAKSLWPSSCNALLSSIILKVLSWLMGILISMFNLGSICHIVVQWKRTKRLTFYNKTVMLINSCDLMIGLYLLNIIIKDITSTKDYVKSDFLWRSSIMCHILAFISLWSTIMEALFIMTVSISRYMIIKYPFKKPIGENSRFFIMVLVPSFSAILVSLAIALRHNVEGLSKLSSPLCLILGKTDDSVTQTVVTATVPLCLMATLSIIFVFYWKLLYLSSQLDSILNETVTEARRKALTRNVILVGITNAVCWFPASLFYLASLFVDTFPIKLMYWVTIMILPINPLMNPIIFNLSNIKSKIKKT